MVQCGERRGPRGEHRRDGHGEHPLRQHVDGSAATYGSSAPGSTRGDSTILPGTLGTSSAAVASHTYSLPGQYPLTLTVKDAGGMSATAMTAVNVTGAGSPTMTANVGGPYSGSVGSSITFDGSGSQAPPGAGYRWTFGDEIVIHASRMTATGSRWQMVSDATAAGGSAVYNADWQQPKSAAAAASPESYVEASFRAAAGVPYRFWIRMRAENDDWNNDAIFVQYSGSVDANGTAVYRIGTSGAMSVALEEGQGAGLSGWGWADGNYGSLDAPIYFNSDGMQRIRIQQRQDGARIDQIVISADRFASAMPGLLKNDTTIVPEFAQDAQGTVVSHPFRFPGVFPVVLTVVDGASRASAATTATIR
jgi:PKD repeat protein